MNNPLDKSTPKQGRREPNPTWVKGCPSPNPSGKPKGSRNKASLLIAHMFEGEAEGIARRTIEGAMAGDSTCLRLVVERICPVRKGAAFKLEGVPEVHSLADVRDAIAAIVGQMTAGEISAEEALSTAAVVDMQRRTIETVELEARIAALEGTRRPSDEP